MKTRSRGTAMCQWNLTTRALRKTALNGCYSVIKWCPTLCDPKDCSTSGFPVLNSLPEFVQTHGPWVSDALNGSSFDCFCGVIVKPTMADFKLSPLMWIWKEVPVIGSYKSGLKWSRILWSLPLSPNSPVLSLPFACGKLVKEQL